MCICVCVHTPCSAGSEQVDNVVMVTQVTEDLQLRHKSIAFFRECTCYRDNTHHTIRTEQQDNGITHFTDDVTNVSAFSPQLWSHCHRFPVRTPSLPPPSRMLQNQELGLTIEMVNTHTHPHTHKHNDEHTQTAQYPGGVCLVETPTCSCTAGGRGQRRCSCFHQSSL